MRNLTQSQHDVYTVLAHHGPLPDHALVPLAQHVLRIKQSSSGIRTRRRELQDRGFVEETGSTVTMPSGRSAKIFKAIA